MSRTRRAQIQSEGVSRVRVAEVVVKWRVISGYYVTYSLTERDAAHDFGVRRLPPVGALSWRLAPRRRVLRVPRRMAAAPRRVVVTGIGLVTPLGVGVEASWRRLLAGDSGVVRLPSLQGLPTEIGAPVPRGEAPDGFDLNRCSLSRPGDSSSLSPFIHFALAAADYNAAVSREEQVAADFNAAIRAYKAANPD